MITKDGAVEEYLNSTAGRNRISLIAEDIKCIECVSKAQCRREARQRVKIWAEKLMSAGPCIN